VTTSESQHWVRSLGVALGLGLVAGTLGLAYVTVEHWLQHFLWTEIPELLGAAEGDVQWWLVLLLPAAGGLLTAAARLLPGDGGHDPLEGLGGGPTPPQYVPSALLAALASLAFGVVLGPEAPLMALGTGAGLLVARLVKAPPSATAYYGFAGAFAAFGVVFGNPLNSAVLLIEVVVVAAGAKVIPMLLPGLVAAGTGYLLFTGVGGWVGVENSSLAIPGIPVPDSLRLTELAWAVVIGVLAALLVHVVRRALPEVAKPIRRLSSFPLLAVSGATIGAIALLYAALTDRSAVQVLFSGQSELDSLVAETSVSVLVIFGVLKLLAYVLSAAAGYRGGLIFPMLAISVALALAVSQVLPGLGTAAAVSAAVAASMSGFLNAPFSGVVFAVLLLGPAGDVTTPVAILASAAAYVVAVRLEHAGATEVPAPPVQSAPV
jgi:H+/Cl- antiporter ClcA